MKKNILLGLAVVLSSVIYGQNNTLVIDDEHDKCGIDDAKSLEMHNVLGDYWGYNYDSLLNDINYWSSYDQVSVTTIGKSTQGRDIYELIITDETVTKSSKSTIFIHARTHPNEIQSFWVTDEIINILISETELGAIMREKCVFHIIPMYNPDGVELEYPRENANGIDIESNWGEDNPEVEVIALKSRFNELMFTDNPVEIALNMHSAYDCNRYFVYHHENGTSAGFAELEKNFIEGIRHYFMDGIKPYDYYVSWSNGTPNYYPESWWWNNYGENVMALTYEDMNCEDAGDYDKTAYAMVRGIADYLGLGYVGIEDQLATNNEDISVYPNPVKSDFTVKFENSQIPNSITITNMLGSIVYQNVNINNDIVNVPVESNMSNGIYLVHFYYNNRVVTKKIIKE